MKYILFISILLIAFVCKSQTEQCNDSILGTFTNQVDGSSSLYFNFIYSVNPKKALSDSLQYEEQDSVQINYLNKKEIVILYLRDSNVLRRDTLKYKFKYGQLIRKKSGMVGIPPLLWGWAGQTYRFKFESEGLTMKYKSWTNFFWIIIPFDFDRQYGGGNIIFYGK